MPMLSSFFARCRRCGPWTAALFLSFLAGASLPVTELARTGAVRLRFPDSGLPALLARFCLPTLISWLLGFFACGVILLPVWTAVCGYVLSTPAALAVQASGTEGFLEALVRFGLPGFAALPLFFFVASFAALCAECALRRLIGRPLGTWQSPLSPPFPVFFVLSLLALFMLSVGTAMF